jgi:hypothetical protein
MAATFVLTLLTDDPDCARAADAAGIDRVGIDLETLGKSARQAGRQTRISDHRADSLARIVPQLKRSAPFARCNPIHPGSRAEVDGVIGYGARVIMLPYFETLGEVEVFSECVGGRARIVPLVETLDALLLVSSLRARLGIEECHFGLNDLAIQMGLRHWWEVLDDERLRRATEAAQEAGVTFGIGGVGRSGDENLPVPANQIYESLLSLGASGAWIARSFFRPVFLPQEFAADVADLRRALDGVANGLATDRQILRKLQDLGAQDVGHVNGSLLSHLQGTCGLLRRWGNRQAVCHAGLCHAVYGTEGFRHALRGDSERKEIAAVIGEEAESLVYLFGACDRDYFYKQLLREQELRYRNRLTRETVSLTPDAVRDLCELTLANELEIARRAANPAKTYGKPMRDVLERMTAFASAGAAAEYERVFGDV